MIYLVPIMPMVHFSNNDPNWYRYSMAAILAGYALIMLYGAYRMLRK